MRERRLLAVRVRGAGWKSGDGRSRHPGAKFLIAAAKTAGGERGGEGRGARDAGAKARTACKRQGKRTELCLCSAVHFATVFSRGARSVRSGCLRVSVYFIKQVCRDVHISAVFLCAVQVEILNAFFFLLSVLAKTAEYFLACFCFCWWWKNIWKPVPRPLPSRALSRSGGYTGIFSAREDTRSGRSKGGGQSNNRLPPLLQSRSAAQPQGTPVASGTRALDVVLRRTPSPLPPPHTHFTS